MRRRHRFLATVGLAASAISAASAQTAPAPAPQDEAPAQASTVEPANTTGVADIVVTATRRSENLQRAPIAVTAVSGDALVSAGVTKPTELTSVVPALQVVSAGGSYSQFYLRGVGNFNGNALSDPAVAFNVDGVYIGRPSSTTGFFYDLERVEVVKGPQGTLYGRNATGGAVNVITHKADLGRTEADATVSYGNYNAVESQADVNLPIGDKVALRAAGTYVRHDPYMQDGTDQQDDLGGRLSLKAQPTSTLTINLVADYFRQRGAGTGGTPLELGIDARPGYLSAAGNGFVTALPNTLLGRTNGPFRAAPYLHNEFWGVSGSIDLATPAGTITVIPAHREGKLDFLSDFPGFYVGSREHDYQTSVETRLTSDASKPFTYIVGAFFYQEKNDVPFFYVNQQSNLNVDSYVQNIHSMATFGRIGYEIVPGLRISAGARYTTEDKSLDGQLLGALRTCVRPSSYFPTYVPGCPTAQPFAVDGTYPAPNFNPAVDGTLTIPSVIDNSGARQKRLSVDKVTYRVGADWQVTSRNLVYASYETGFKSGGAFFSADAGIYRPETIRALTLGSKNRFFEDRLQVNLEGFLWRYRDQQITHIITDSSRNAILATENVGRATFKGVEAEVRLRPVPRTTLGADVQYLSAVYNDFTYSEPNFNGGAGNGTGCVNTSVTATNYVVNCSGKRPPNAPQWTLNLDAQQNAHLGGGLASLQVRGHYQTTTLTGLEFTPIEYQRAYWTADAQLSFTPEGRRLTISAFVNNAFNKTVLASSFPAPFTFFTSGSLRPPRTYGLRLAGHF